MAASNSDTGIVSLADSLYGLRGVAALIVVLSHASKKHLFLLPYLDLSGTGKLAVWLFFVLSSFTLTYQYLFLAESDIPGRFHKFIIRRAFRIFPLYWVALLIDYFRGQITSEHVLNSVLLSSAPNHFWTIPVEFQYYFVIPFAVYFLRRSSADWQVILVAYGFILASHFFLDQIALASWRFISCFLAGSLLAFFAFKRPLAPARFTLVRWMAWFSVILSIIATPAVMDGLDFSLYMDVNLLRNQSTLFGFAFIPLVMAVTILPSWRNAFSSKALVWLGRISFSVYLLHPLALDMLSFINVKGILGAWMVLAFVLALGLIGFVLIERPARNIGYKLT